MVRPAAAEAKAEAKTFKWHGLELEMPEEMPGDLMFGFYELEEQQKSGQGRVGPMLSLIKSLVGDKQFGAIRSVVKAEGLSIDDAIDATDELLTGLLELYGMGLGES